MGNTAAVMTMVCVYAGGFQGGAGVGGGADVPREEIRGSLISRSICLYSGKKAPQRLLSAPVESHIFGLK